MFLISMYTIMFNIHIFPHIRIRDILSMQLNQLWKMWFSILSKIVLEIRYSHLSIFEMCVKLFYYKITILVYCCHMFDCFLTKKLLHVLLKTTFFDYVINYNLNVHFIDTSNPVSIFVCKMSLLKRNLAVKSKQN